MRRPRSDYLIGGKFRRLYHYHIRKTAGTSLNAAFWQLAGVDFLKFGTRTKVVKNDLIIVRGEKKEIERGHYFYASSHIPAHELKLPEDTFTITILRDPMDRLLSYYQYLLWARHDPLADTQEPFFKELAPEIANLENGFVGFLENTPKEHLLRQLFMFSSNYDVSEATARILACSAVGFCESFVQFLNYISECLDLVLKVKEKRRFSYGFRLSATEFNEAREILEPEFRLVEQVRRNMVNSYI
jgi:hypothetical protein